MNPTAKRMAIGDRTIGDGCPVYVIAELSGNHHQSLERALEIVSAAAAAGVDAVKLQTYTPATLTIDCDAAPFRIGAGTIWEGRTLYDLYGEAFTPWEWHEPIMTECRRLGVDCFSTPFDETAVDFLESLDVKAYKIASFELVDLSLVRRVAATGRPLIMSTGMATVSEIDAAVGAAREAGAVDLALLRCNSAYPAPAEEMDLRTIPHLAATFGVPVGLSDHTLGTGVAIAAVALGASILEKHVALTRSEPGPDTAFSLEPAELATLVAEVRIVSSALGTVRYGPTPQEKASMAFRRSLFVVADVAAGELLTGENVRSIRPADGLAPDELNRVLGRRAAVDLPRGTPLAWDLIG